ncbi:hypothetical protein PFISCL1PPCAC_21541, partial [Pristionchus fissidentatus]
HVLCDRCRQINAARGRVRCRMCRGVFSIVLPLSNTGDNSNRHRAVGSRAAQSINDGRKWEERGPTCTGHNNDGLMKLQCPCGEAICRDCAISSHAGHFNYAELFSKEELLKQSVERILLLKPSLLDERNEIWRRKREIENQIKEANNETASIRRSVAVWI